MHEDPELLEEEFYEEIEKRIPEKEMHLLRVECDEELLIYAPPPNFLPEVKA